MSKGVMCPFGGAERARGKSAPILRSSADLAGSGEGETALRTVAATAPLAVSIIMTASGGALGGGFDGEEAPAPHPKERRRIGPESILRGGLGRSPPAGLTLRAERCCSRPLSDRLGTGMGGDDCEWLRTAVVHNSVAACGLLLLKVAGLRLRKGMSRLPASLLMLVGCGLAADIRRVTGAAVDGAVGVLADVRPMAMTSRGVRPATLLVEPDAGTTCRGAGEGLRSARDIEERCSTVRSSCQSISCSCTLMPGPPPRKGALAERVTKAALTFRGSLAATAAATVAKLVPGVAAAAVLAGCSGKTGGASLMTVSSTVPSTVGMEPASLPPRHSQEPLSGNSRCPAAMSVALQPPVLLRVSSCEGAAASCTSCGTGGESDAGPAPAFTVTVSSSMPTTGSSISSVSSPVV